MARSADSVKRRQWQQRLRRFKQGHLTVAAFCQAEGVSVPSFYQWRRILDRTAGDADMRPRVSPSFVRSSAVSRQAFVPVEVVRSTTIEIHLPNGARLTVPAGDQASLDAAVAAVGRLPRASEEVSSC
ncbi:MAG: IS66 family insertion sequence element accessory protein TnpA [Bryobacteraceae bacterium]